MTATRLAPEGAPVGIGVVGLGVIGRRMLEQAAQRTDLRVVGAWDIDPAACDRARADFPSVPIADSPDSLFADPAVHVAYVGTPPAHHREYALMAAARGLRLFCEKPLTARLDEAHRLVDELRALGTPNAVNFVFASAPAAEHLARRLRDGAVGRPRAVDIRLFFARWPRDWQAGAVWLRERDQGGFVREVLSHFVYLCLKLFGDCRLCGGAVSWPADPAACERAAVATLDCGGVPVTVSAAAGGWGPDEVVFTLRGERGALRLTDWYQASESDGSAWQAVSVPGGALPDPRTAAYQAQLAALAAFARGAVHGLPDAAEALRVQSVIEGLLALPAAAPAR
ncbi:MAG: Gfo/Idh/MocA family oxidoreductase [Betaproteobacteria bacterium]|nr:Gfo/Idh/MocA family oxidoreductase [Betaproteobacteria bacterium]